MIENVSIMILTLREKIKNIKILHQLYPVKLTPEKLIRFESGDVDLQGLYVLETKECC